MSRLTEAAAARTTAEQLDHRTVEHDFRGRNDEIFGIIHRVQVGHNALLYKFRCAVQCADRRNRAVLVVVHLVQARHIHTWNIRRCTQELRLAPALAHRFAVQIGQLQHDFLAVTDHEQINEIRKRLRIVGTRTAGNDQIFQSGALLCKQRHTTEIQHI